MSMVSSIWCEKKGGGVYFCPSFVLFVLLFRLVNSVLFVLLLCTFRFSGLTESGCIGIP